MRSSEYKTNPFPGVATESLGHHLGKELIRFKFLTMKGKTRLCEKDFKQHVESSFKLTNQTNE